MESIARLEIAFGYDVFNRQNMTTPGGPGEEEGKEILPDHIVNKNLIGLLWHRNKLIEKALAQFPSTRGIDVVELDKEVQRAKM